MPALPPDVEALLTRERAWWRLLRGTGVASGEQIARRVRGD
ncbi:hypothetical protein [Tsukamurella soli]